MNILGYLLILILPYMAGYIISQAINRREANQIETYLIGFFFLFLLQGVIFTGGMYLGKDYSQLCKIFSWTIDCIVILFVLVFIIGSIAALSRSDNRKSSRNPRMTNEELMTLMTLILVALAVVYRVIALKEYLRMDDMISSVRAIVRTGEAYSINPFTNQPYSLGVIASRRIISLPSYYAFYVTMFGVDETVLLYVIATLQTVMCTYMACSLFIIPIVRSRRKTLVFDLFLGGVILSGDYFSGSIVHKLLHNGYSGAAIVACVMLPYVMYVLTNAYRQERTGSNWGYRISNAVKVLICLVASVFITPLVSGALLIVIVVFAMGCSCVFRFTREELSDGGSQ